MSAAKIAAIALHTAPLLDTRRGAAMRLCGSLFGCGNSLFECAGFPVHRAGKSCQAFVQNE